MKNFILLFFVVFIPFCLSGQHKVIDESGKKPGWVYGAQSGYVIGMATAGNVEEARDKAMNSVREQITESVAVHVTSVSKDMVREIMSGNSSQLSSEYERMTQTQTGKRDYLKGISPSRIDEVYWEKRRDKKSKAISYFYAVKYPFNRFDLDELVAAFEEKDAELTRLLEQQVARSENYNTVEELEQCISSLQKLIPVFIDERKSKAEVTLEKCRNLLNAVYIRDAGSKPGTVRYALFIGERRVSTSEKPQVTSNCARITGTNLGSGIVEIDYNFEDCYEEPGNHVSVVYRIYRKTLDKKFFFGADADNFDLRLTGDLQYNTDNNEIILRLESGYDHPVSVDFIEMKGELGWHLNKKLSRQISSGGIHLVNVVVEKPLDSAVSNDLVSGYIHYSSVNSGEKKTLRIYRKNIMFVE